jgi:hydroxymethylbilane synthase
MLATLRGGCLAPIGAKAEVSSGEVRLRAVVLSADGKRRLVAEGRSSHDAAAALGSQVAKDLLAQGAGELIATSRQP